MKRSEERDLECCRRLFGGVVVGAAAANSPVRAVRVGSLKRTDSDVRLGTVADSVEFDTRGLSIGSGSSV